MRYFIYNGEKVNDPDPEKSIDEIRQSMADHLPELYNASHAETKDGEDTIITFTKRVGTKGGEAIGHCRLGWCAVEKTNYGRSINAIKLIDEDGICPICKGEAAPTCYQPALSPTGWCMQVWKCPKDPSLCKVALGGCTTKTIIPTKKGAAFPYKIVSIKEAVSR